MWIKLSSGYELVNLSLANRIYITERPSHKGIQIQADFGDQQYVTVATVADNDAAVIWLDDMLTHMNKELVPIINITNPSVVHKPQTKKKLPTKK